MQSSSIVILGSKNDPQPVLRANAPEAFPWPEGAMFAVVFKREAFPGFAWQGNYGSATEKIEFFGADGWPLDLPSERKSSLGDVMKREFQVFPQDWRSWDESDWRSAAEVPEHFPALRAQAQLVSQILPFTPFR